MEPVLNEFELRVLGALVEKQIVTPDYYPLTLNALVNACNQKNHRDPVVAYDETTVQRALDSLREKKLAYTFHGSEARAVKYGHVFPKSYELNEEETALMCVLILRGPQTPGELRSRTAHLHQFESLSRVEELLMGLSTRPDPLVVKLARQAGARESRFAHLLGGEVQPDAVVVKSGEPSKLDRLEEEVVALRQEVTELKQLFEAFRKQFE